MEACCHLLNENRNIFFLCYYFTRFYEAMQVDLISPLFTYVSSKRWQDFPTENEDILCIVKFFTFSAGLDRLQLAC